ncbi:hypothetical protein AB833_16765 [Chromatiales bacterium (ex Bugula neritina AB1)]|nr:hypothetical protein AB833_16765 [Chromatiales bacterium (ex Bugula neritina AB1)]
MAIGAALASPVLSAAPNNAPSFAPGAEPTSNGCDGLVEISNWAQQVTDGDGETSGMKFIMKGISNPDIFSKYPFVSWPSLTLSYRIKPGTPAGLSSTVTAVLQDTSGTGQGGNDTSEAKSWSIATSGCTDIDLDGIADEIDPEIVLPVDTDGDGIYDRDDDDDDNDGIPDVDEGSGLVDTDGDGTPDSLDTDSDNDGILDADEPGDSDGDGIPDSQEPNGDDVTTDTDGDGITDDIDLDDDNDGIPDSLEGDGAVDTDGDGIPDSRDLDSDGDGISDLVESGADAAALDTDNDGMIDGPVGNNGLADALETSVDSGVLIAPPGNGDTVVDGQSGDGVARSSGGGGCTLGTGSGFDPLLLLTALMAVVGLRRRRT